jgi:hypothetical protein
MTNPKPVEGRPAKAADDWLDSYRSKARTATGTLLALCVTLSVAWIALIEPAVTDLTNYVDSPDTAALITTYNEQRDALEADVLRRAQAEAVRKARPILKVMSLLPGSLLSGVPSRPLRAVKPGRTVVAARTNVSEEEKRLNFMRVAIDVERQQYDRLSTLIETNRAVKAQFNQPATYNLLGAAIPLNKQWIVLAWAATLLGLLVYAGVQRQLLVKQLLKAKYAFDQVASVPPATSDVGDFAGESPFWLAPIRTLHLDRTERGAVQRALGWTERDARLAHAAVVLFLVVFVAVGMRVASIGFLITDDQDRVNRLVWKGDTIIPMLADFNLVALLTAALVLAVNWIVPLRVQDPAVVVVTRRNLLLGGSALVVVSATVAFTAGRFLNWKGDHVQPSRDSPRIVANKGPSLTMAGPPEPFTRVEVPPGFYRFGDDDPLLGYVAEVPGEPFRWTWMPRGKSPTPPPTILTREQLPQVRRRHFSFAIERAVLAALPSRRQEAEGMLRDVIRYDLQRGVRVNLPGVLAVAGDALQQQTLETFNKEGGGQTGTMLREAQKVFMPDVSLNPLNYRLYDLMARLLVANPDALDAFAKEVEDHPGADAILVNRVAKWRDPDWKWRKHAQSHGAMKWVSAGPVPPPPASGTVIDLEVEIPVR